MTRRAWAGVVLAASISGTPYLDRHADDAVRWRGWSDSTLAEARSANRLILVSVGFFACHGCHVMERESFENSSVASAINERTIPVLIDRDDRPDLDARFAADLRRVGVEPGWPMTLWLLPDGRAISAATYLGPQDLVERTARLADLWARDPDRLKAVAATTDAAALDAAPPPQGPLTPRRPCDGPRTSFTNSPPPRRARKTRGTAGCVARPSFLATCRLQLCSRRQLVHQPASKPPRHSARSWLRRFTTQWTGASTATRRTMPGSHRTGRNSSTKMCSWRSICWPRGERPVTTSSGARAARPSTS